jgi:O-antigen ligase
MLNLKIVHWLKTIQTICLACFAFSIPLNQVLANNFFFILIISSILLFNNKENFKSSLFYSIPLIGLLFLFVLDSIRNSNIQIFISKLFLVFIPILFLVLKLDFPKLRSILRAYISGLCISYLICFIHIILNFYSFTTYSFTPIPESLIENQTIGNINYFISSIFTYPIAGRVYFALTFILGIYILYFYPFIVKSKVLRIILNIVFITAIIQSYSVSAYIILLSFILLYTFSRIKKRNYLVLLFTVPILIAILIFNRRLFSEKNVSTSDFQDGIRIEIWDCIFNSISLDLNLIIGKGTILAQNMINNCIIEKTKWSSAWVNDITILNAHNQYLQYFNDFGISGLSILLFIIIGYKFYFIKGIKQSVFIFVFVIVFFSESILNRNLGILLFTFFYSLIINMDLLNKKTI